MSGECRNAGLPHVNFVKLGNVPAETKIKRQQNQIYEIRITCSPITGILRPTKGARYCGREGLRSGSSSRRRFCRRGGIGVAAGGDDSFGARREATGSRWPVCRNERIPRRIRR